MIDLETLRKGPCTPEKPLQILPESEVRKILVVQIVKACASTYKIRGLAEAIPDSNKEFSLFYIDAGEEQSKVGRDDQRGLCERDRLQQIGFEVMRQYGLNTDLSLPRYSKDGWDSKGVLDFKDGTSREILIYPSQTVQRLSFQRWRDFYTETDKTINVIWSVEGQKKPFRENLRRFLPK